MLEFSILLLTQWLADSVTGVLLCAVLGTSYLQQFCTSVVNAIVSPFVLLDIAMDSASFLAANSISQVPQVRGPLLNSLLQKCLQM